MEQTNRTMVASGKACVVLLHGLARSSRSMLPMERYLRSEGFQVANIHYPSTRFPVEILAPEGVERGLAQLPPEGPVHFVTHSMGGILLRWYVRHRGLDRLGRVVMLGPPNRGSEVVDKLRSWPPYRWLNGPAGQQLGTDEDSLTSRLGPATFSLGVIAGDRSINPLLSLMLPGPNDGKVTVERTRLEGMADHLTLHVTHPLMMRCPTVLNQTAHFLRRGYFAR